MFDIAHFWKGAKMHFVEIFLKDGGYYKAVLWDREITALLSDEISVIRDLDDNKIEIKRIDIGCVVISPPKE